MTEVGSLWARASFTMYMYMNIFVKREFTFLATNASFQVFKEGGNLLVLFSRRGGGVNKTANTVFEAENMV